MRFARHAVFALMASLPLLSGCKDEAGNTTAAADLPSFINIGEFAIARKATYTEVRDGVGRTLALISRGGKAPAGFAPTMVAEVPVERAIAYGAFEVGLMKAMGVTNALVGLTDPKEKWTTPEVRQEFDEGRITYVGDASRIDFERVKAQRPGLVMTWDPSIVPMMDSLGIPVIITSTPLATCLNIRVRLVEFLASFFGKEAEAQAYYCKVEQALQDIHERTKGQPRPKAMWGNIFEKRVLVEPGNAWVAELVGLAQSDYQFKDVYDRSCVEISTERFIYSGDDADIYFTYRTPRLGATSKAALARTNPLLAQIRPLKSEGKTYAPLPHYVQSSDRLDEILTEILTIFHPNAYPGYKLQFFMELPDQEPQATRLRTH